MKAPALTAAAILPALLASTTFAADPNDFRVYNFDRYGNGISPDSNDLVGRLFVPDDYDPTQNYALVTFYHGLGERRSNGGPNTAQVNGNINNLLAAAKEHNFLLYAPQTWGGWGSDQLNISVSQMAKITQEYSVDLNRIYATGLSMGGGGTWDVLSAYPHVFAAAAPIAAVTDIGGRTRPAELVNTPIWAYHATNDGTVNVSNTRNMVNLIREARGDSPLTFPLAGNTGAPFYNDGTTFYDDGTLRYSEYITGNHGIWGRAYGEAALYDWMLGHTRTIPRLQAGQTIRFDLGASEATGSDDEGVYWNSTSYGLGRSLGPVRAFAKTTQGTGTTVTLDVTTAFSGENRVDDNPLHGDGWYAASWSGPAQFRLTGLTPGGSYAIEIFATAANADGSFNRVARYAIGEEHQDLDYLANVADTALFESATADETGAITVDVMVAPDTNTRYAYLNWLSITAVPEPASLAVLAAAGAALLGGRQKRGDRQ